MRNRVRLMQLICTFILAYLPTYSINNNISYSLLRLSFFFKKKRGKGERVWETGF